MNGVFQKTIDKNARNEAMPACGAVELFKQNHLRKTLKAPRGPSLVFMFFIAIF